MDPTAFPGGYFPAMQLPAALSRYPYPATSSSGAGGRGMVFYPQAMSLGDTSDRSEPQTGAESPQSSGGEGPRRPMDKKLRRQIANSNERRRMQSINTGFHNLRVLMPHLQGEKLSKASVLQHAAEHIYRLNQERERLVQQNTSLRMMLSKFWNSGDSNRGDILTENKVNKATSPMCFDDERAAAKELEQIFTSQRELEAMKAELERERALRLNLEMKCQHIKDRTPSEEDESDESETDVEQYRNKRPRTANREHLVSPNPRNNLDIIVRAIRQIEGDAFSRSTTPTCASQENQRNSGNGRTFRPISAGGVDSSRVSPVTPVCAS